MKSTYPGFTFLEVIAVVALSAVLIGVIIIIVNPSRKFAQARNSEREVEVEAIIEGVYRYYVDNNSVFPDSIPVEPACGSLQSNEICRSDVAGVDCTGRVDLSAVTEGTDYLSEIPTDPSAATENGTGYFVSRNSEGRLTVCAPNAELGITIENTR